MHEIVNATHGERACVCMHVYMCVCMFSFEEGLEGVGLGQPGADPCSPLHSRSAVDESSSKHVHSCQLASVCECVLCVHVYTCLDSHFFHISV